ncbi:MAG: phage portal protein, partial [Dehalococcoidales bacterium]|nr:phage portal protein [Dehalococcoidales bacterium]
MNILDRFRIALKSFVQPRLPGQELVPLNIRMPRSTFNYASEVDGRQSAIVMACVSWAQRTYPEAPIILNRIAKGGEWEKVVQHPVIDLLNTPNPYYDGLLLQMGLIADWMIDGNGYYRKIRSNAGRVVQLWWIPSTMIEPMWPMDGSVYISHYRYMSGTANENIPEQDIVHFRNGIDDRNIRKGCSPLKSLFREIFTDDEAANMTSSLLRNLGVPGLVISPGKGIVASKEDADATKKWFEESFTGDKRGKPLVMAGETVVSAFGFSPQQMDLRALRQIPEERISGVLGIPAIVAGLGAGLARSTFSNFKEAREAAYESTIIPTQRLINSTLKRQLLIDFEDDLSIWDLTCDLSEVRILQEDENNKVTRVNQMVTGGYLMVDDAQRMTGAPVDDSAHYYLRAFNIMPAYPEGKSLLPAKKETEDVAEMRKALWWGNYSRHAATYEIRFADKLKSIFKGQQPEIIENLKYGKKENLFNQDKSRQEYTEAATPILSSLITEAITNARRLMDGKKQFGPEADQRSLAWLKTHIEWAALEFGEETAKLLSAKLAEGFALGESMDMLAGRVKDVINFCSDVRSLRIARTETIQASAQGAIEGFKDMG